MDTERHEHDLGLTHDLSTLLSRRRALMLLVSAGVVTVVGCGDDDDATTAGTGVTTAATTATTAGATVTAASATAATAGTTATTAASSDTSSTTAAASTEEIPEETAGPYPGDGSNGPNVLTESGIVRSDIRSSFGTSSTVAEGILTTVELTVTNAGEGTPYAGAAVYLWHCDRDGNYSLYSDGVTDENYLRGVQEAGSDGKVTFTSIFPACYSGRWPHIHFEVYPSVTEATGAGSIEATSQLALPEDTCNLVYATSGYEQSVSNLSQVSLETDNVFSDGVDQQLATVSGDVDNGFTVSLIVPV